MLTFLIIVTIFLFVSMVHLANKIDIEGNLDRLTAIRVIAITICGILYGIFLTLICKQLWA